MEQSDKHKDNQIIVEPSVNAWAIYKSPANIAWSTSTCVRIPCFTLIAHSYADSII